MTPLHVPQRLVTQAARTLPWFAACAIAVLIVTGIVTSMPVERAASRTAPHTPIEKKERGALGNAGQRLLSMLPLAPPHSREATLVAAVIENHVAARPHQRGLEEAQVIIEMIAEGDITRFLALFRSDRLPKHIGPIRSLRPHAVNILSSYDALLLHIGGSALAYEALKEAPRVRDHDGIRYDGETYARDPDIPPPHNLFIEKTVLRELLENKRPPMPQTTFPLFRTGREVPRGEEAKDIHLNFWSPQHDVTFTYDALSGIYRRATFASSRQASPAAVLILETEVQGYKEAGAIPWTRTFGRGRMLLFARGKRVEGTWHRERDTTFAFVTSEGTSIVLPPGQVWITFLPSLEQVTSSS